MSRLTPRPYLGTDPAYELLAEIALLAWEATGGTAGVDPTDAWNTLCALLEQQPESFPDALVHLCHIEAHRREVP